MLVCIKHRFPEITSGKEYYINHNTDNGEIVFSVIKHGVGVRFHHRIYLTEDFCKDLCLSGEDHLMWYLKFGKILPKYISKLTDGEIVYA